MKYQFYDWKTKKLLSTMPEGTWKEAKAEQERLMELCDCVVKIVECDEKE